MKKQFPNYLQDAEECKRFLSEFTDPETGTKKYLEALQQVANRQAIVFPVHLDDVQDFFGVDSDLLLRIKTNTWRYTSIFANVADTLMPKPTVVLIDDNYADALSTQRKQRLEQMRGPDDVKSKIPADLTRRFELVIYPLLADKPKKLREIRAEEVGKLVSVSGIITRVTEVKPLMRVMCYICGVCGFESYQEVADKQFTPLVACPSPDCKQNKTEGKLYPQTRGSKFIKFQEVKLQELPTEVPVGHVPRTITLKAYGELTRQTKPGDFVTIAGIYLPEPFRGYRAVRAGLTADTHIHVNRIDQHKKVQVDWNVSKELLEEIENKSEEKDIFDQLASSIAPEIFGHLDVKKALLLLLVGGVTRKMSDMTIRGDLNLLLMGDPGVAKSQLLKHISRIAPRSVYTTGKGSSGVGLTAAVTRDPLTGEIALEGGALVLADKGICCIDEFDKMEESDRTAIHEVMEQQTVSIAKAGITTQLNARTSILAAANPVWGRYDPRKSPEANLGLPTSIISRFDLLFILRDKPNEDYDEALARHITYVHRHEKAPPLEFKAFDEHFLRAYISRAKQFEPFVPPELAEEIIQNYIALRREPSSKGFREEKNKLHNDRQRFCTARSLLSILRLAQSLARVHFRHQITKEDTEEAIRLLEVARASGEEEETKKKKDPISAIYAIITDYLRERKLNTMKISDIQGRVLRQYTQVQLDEVLDKYEDLSVWKLSRDREKLTLV